MKIIVCDDSKADRENWVAKLNKVAKSMDKDIHILEYESARQLLFGQGEQIFGVDIILFDIHMPDMTGMEAAAKLRNEGFRGELVFLTVSKEYMLGAFDVRAFNYIVKGETDNQKIERVLRDVMNIADEKSKEYILFTGIGEFRNVPIASIKYFEVRGKIVTVYYGHKSFEFVSTIGKLENILFSRGFVRIHRSFMVAMSMVRSYSYESLEIIDGTRLPVGRTYYNNLKEAVNRQRVV